MYVYIDIQDTYTCIYIYVLDIYIYIDTHIYLIYVRHGHIIYVYIQVSRFEQQVLSNYSLLRDLALKCCGTVLCFDAVFLYLYIYYIIYYYYYYIIIIYII